MNNISNNIKKVLLIFLILFMFLIAYITYFEIFNAPDIVSNPLNKRLWDQRNEVLRGTIYDRNLNPLTKSERVGTITQRREYLGGAAFAQSLGYEDPKYGITGLEETYDSQLMKDDTSISNIFNFSKVKQEKTGRNVVTTLDMNLQEKAYALLGNNIGAVVALNPKTGEILAMVSKPSFDPNNLEANWNSIDNDKNRPLLNRAVSGLYPPGSTFKVITALSSLENLSGVNNKIFHDNGKLVFNSTQSLSDFEGEVPGTLSFKDAFVLSSNVVFGGLGLELGNNKLKATAENFYFNKPIPSDGIIIDNSKFPSYKTNEVGNIAQSAIGQSGVLASPMQMALVASTIANGGVMMKPYLVNKVMTNKGSLVKQVSILVQGHQPFQVLNYIFLGYRLDNNNILYNIIKGGGIASMLKTCFVVFIACVFAGILEGIKAFDSIKKKLVNMKLTGSLLYSLTTLISTITAAFGCTQSVAVVLTDEIMKDCYKKKENYQFALNIENSCILTSALIPWNIAALLCTTIINVNMYDFVPYAFFLYIFPLVHFLYFFFKEKLIKLKLTVN